MYKVLNCLQVLVGDNATRLAVRLLGNIAQGRGASLPLDTVINPHIINYVVFLTIKIYFTYLGVCGR